MAVSLHLNYNFDCIKDVMDIYAVIPQKKHVCCEASPHVMLDSIGRDYPLLVLLHDEPSDPFELRNMTNITRFSDETGIVVVIPQGTMSYYTDYAQRDINTPKEQGGTISNAAIESGFTELLYGQYVEKVLSVARNILPVSRERKKTYIGGIGMGGFGAMKHALSNKDIYSAVFVN